MRFYMSREGFTPMRTVYALQFLTPTAEGSTAWITHLQTDTEAQAWQWLERFERFEYPTKRWRWVLAAENTSYSFA